MADIIVVGVVLILVGAALLYIRREKKKGARCIGCPYSGTCGKAKDSDCGCHEN